MPDLLATELTREHALELLRLEKEELARLFEIYEEGRKDILDRLVSIGRGSFTAQHLRVTQAQIETGMATMVRKLEKHHEAATTHALENSVRQTLAEIQLWEPDFRGSTLGRINLDALRRVAAPEGLLLNKFNTSIQTYGLGVISETQRRLGVHLVKRSNWTDMATDVAGRLKKHGIRGSLWKAERIVRTEMVDVLNVGHDAAIGAAAEFIPGLKSQWDAHLDERTSDGCIYLNGKVRTHGTPWRWQGRQVYRPPLLPNCRSRLTPWHEDWAREEAAGR